MKTTYGELLLVFGDFAKEYEDMAEDMLDRYYWDTIANHMDDGIREEIHAEFAPCDNKTFLIAYMGAHVTEFGEDFTIS